MLVVEKNHEHLAQVRVLDRPFQHQQRCGFSVVPVAPRPGEEVDVSYLVLAPPLRSRYHDLSPGPEILGDYFRLYPGLLPILVKKSLGAHLPHPHRLIPIGKIDREYTTRTALALGRATFLAC